jgi:uncharacterized protein (TIGR03066 family)
MSKIQTRLLCVFAVVMILVSACGGGATLKDKIIGKWEAKDEASGLTMTFEFMKDGKVGISAAGMSFEGSTYKWVDDDTLELTMTMLDQSETTQLDVKLDGDKMSMTEAGGGETLEFTKVK